MNNTRPNLKHKKRFFEFLIEKGLLICGSMTGIIIILIVIFLFKEGASFFTNRIIEQGYVLAINAKNPIRKIDSKDIKDIFDAKITNWKELGGNDQEIMLFRFEDLTEFYTEEELGKDFELVPEKINEVIAHYEGIIAFVPEMFIPEDFKGVLIDDPRISLAAFFGGTEWIPTTTPSPQFGVLPLLLGTLWVSIAAILIALPLSLAIAIYLAEIANMRVRNILKPLIELLAGIPSVVYGFFGLIVVVPFVQKVFGLPLGETGLTGSLILAIMALPTIVTVAEDAMRNTPRSMKEASLALGATQWQTIQKVVLPYSKSGISAAVVLGIGRAIGETMAVLMVTGNAAVIPTTLMEPLRTIPATIAAELGEAPKGGVHYEALFLLGCILFLITLIISITVDHINRKKTYA
ncbi:MAG: phosphate ABC transporter permease subunit PstC [Bacteroidales bacterium]